MEEIIKQRLKRLTLEILNLVDELPNKISTRVISQQIVKSSTSSSANYRAACRGKSTADFVNKLKIVEEEMDETIHWLEVIEEGGLSSTERISPLKKEANELLSIIIASIKTVNKRLGK